MAAIDKEQSLLQRAKRFLIWLIVFVLPWAAIVSYAPPSEHVLQPSPAPQWVPLHGWTTWVKVTHPGRRGLWRATVNGLFDTENFADEPYFILKPGQVIILPVRTNKFLVLSDAQTDAAVTVEAAYCFPRWSRRDPGWLGTSEPKLEPWTPRSSKP